MKKFVIAALGGTVAGLLMTTQFAGPLIAQEPDKPANVYKQLDLFGDVFERIRSDYVEEVDESKLIEAAINGMLTSLDPHSSFMNAEAYTDMRTQTRGSFGGLGIEVTQEDGFVKVVTPMDGTPADAAGVEAGDFITHVDGESLMGLQLDDAVELMRGEVGSEIVITVVREGEPEPPLLLDDPRGYAEDPRRVVEDILERHAVLRAEDVATRLAGVTKDPQTFLRLFEEAMSHEGLIALAEDAPDGRGRLHHTLFEVPVWRSDHSLAQSEGIQWLQGILERWRATCTSA